MAVKDFDFSGYATKNDLLCSDGRTIRKDAFRQNHGQKVPLVWQHLHNDPSNVLGHAVLENRDDGVYAWCKFNDTPAGTNAKLIVKHGDVTALSIYANQLVERAKIVHAGSIREVSLVLSGANPGAYIDSINIIHSDGTESFDDEAIIYTGLPLSLPEVEHADKEPEQPTEKEEEPMKHAAADNETVGDVINTLNEKQKNVIYALLAQVFEDNAGDVSQSDIEGESFMKTNVFEGKENEEKAGRTLTHAQVLEIFATAQKTGSLKEAFLAHAVTYGIENIDYLFPDAKAVTSSPTFVKRDMVWVGKWMSGTRHTPFSRIKSLSADLTLEDARAKGYVKGALKKDEFFALTRRITTPTTVYKKQKLDRDDIVDITDLDVVAWLKAEMRMMLDEEIARAGLIGDGRDVASADKIIETNIRPIYKDDVLYAHRIVNPAAATTEEIIESMITGRENYKGTGTPNLYTTTAFLNTMLLLKDSLGRRIYRSVAELETELRVGAIIEVPVMSGVSRVDTVPEPDVTINLLGIIVNPNDYTYGADKGGNVGMFEDFDIDYNQYKYLIETRCSGALVDPKTALIIEQNAV